MSKLENIQGKLDRKCMVWISVWAYDRNLALILLVRIRQMSLMQVIFSCKKIWLNYTSHRIHVWYIWYMLTFGVYWWQMLPYMAYMDPMGMGKCQNWKYIMLTNPHLNWRWARINMNQPHLPFEGFLQWGFPKIIGSRGLWPKWSNFGWFGVPMGTPVFRTPPWIPCHSSRPRFTQWLQDVGLRDSRRTDFVSCPVDLVDACCCCSDTAGFIIVDGLVYNTTIYHKCRDI